MPLLTTITEFKKYIAIDANTKIASLTPYINEAEQLYIVPLLGQHFYDEFLPLYVASVLTVSPVALSADNAALIPYIHRCLAYYAQLHAQLHLAVTFGDMGTRQHRAEDSDAAPRWMQEKLQFQALRNGDIHADKLLEYLETNASPSKYATWNTNANTKLSGTIVYSTAIASRHIAINNSRRVYLQLRSTIQEIEKRTVPKLIGKDQYDLLITKIQAGTLTADEKLLVGKLEPIIAKRALYMRLPFMRVQVDMNGIFLYSGTDELLKSDQRASDADIKILRQQLMGGGDGEFGYINDEEELRQFILDNIDTYPLIKVSAVYTVQPDPGPTWRPPNDPLNKHFAV